MAQKNSYITVTDQFCGAGGSTQGAIASGAEVKLALNHWKLAIETYSTNNQNTLVDCTDVSACDPRRYPSTDILITSPECTNHSLAKGVKIAKKQMDLFNSGKVDPAAERSRATMWDVPRFAEYHNYNAIIVENVVDAKKWVMFDAWLIAMQSLGYNHKCVFLNSMHCHPTPQSRDRMYVVFWKKANKAPNLNFQPKSYCIKCAKDVHALQAFKRNQKSYKYRTGYIYSCPSCTSEVEPYYYAAFNCIDWSDIGTRIGDRKKDLSDNTKRRINCGIDKYGHQRFIVQTVNGGYHKFRSKAVTDPLFTQTTLQSNALISPFIINDQHSTGVDFRVKSVMDHVQGITTQPHFKVIMPFIIKGEHSMVDPQLRSIIDPIQTQVTRQTMSLVTPPLIIENKKTSTARKISEPLACSTTVNYHGLLTTEAWNSFIHYNYGQDTLSHISQALGSCVTRDRHSVITYSKPKIEDCYYRMLKPSEIQSAMAFEREYVVLGSGKDKVKQLGNAVTPPAMAWLTQQVIESFL